MYTYDFGDDWRHCIEVEGVYPIDPGLKYPHCLGGSGAPPPEDVGGVGGYENFLSLIGDPDHQEHGETLDWIGGSFDPGEFDLIQTNKALRPI